MSESFFFHFSRLVCYIGVTMNSGISHNVKDVMLHTLYLKKSNTVMQPTFWHSIMSVVYDASSQ